MEAYNIKQALKQSETLGAFPRGGIFLFLRRTISSHQTTQLHSFQAFLVCNTIHARQQLLSLQKETINKARQ